MPCFYCLQEDYDTEDYGSCTLCHLAVCVNPSGRWDNRFHGEPCVCGCGQLVCEKHLLEHARSNHDRDDGAVCFPALWIAVGGGGIRGGSAIALQPTRRYDPAWRDDIDRFLNVVRPGHHAMRILATELPEMAAEWSGRWGDTDEPKVIVNPQFISPSLVVTIIAHAADAVGAASEPLLRYDGIPPGMTHLAEDLGVFPEQLRYSCVALARWHRGASRLEPGAIQPWLPADAPHGFARYLARVIEEQGPRSEHPDALLHALYRRYYGESYGLGDQMPGVSVDEVSWSGRGREAAPGVSFEEVSWGARDDEEDEEDDDHYEHPPVHA